MKARGMIEQDDVAFHSLTFCEMETHKIPNNLLLLTRRPTL